MYVGCEQVASLLEELEGLALGGHEGVRGAGHAHAAGGLLAHRQRALLRTEDVVDVLEVHLDVLQPHLQRHAGAL